MKIQIGYDGLDSADAAIAAAGKLLASDVAAIALSIMGAGVSGRSACRTARRPDVGDRQ